MLRNATKNVRTLHGSFTDTYKKDTKINESQISDQVDLEDKWIDKKKADLLAALNMQTAG